MQRNILGLAINVALTAMAHGVDGIHQHILKEPLNRKAKTIRQWTEPGGEIIMPHQGFRESLRRSNPERYRELLAAESQDRGNPSPQQTPES